MAKLTDYRVLTFDCDGTLIDWETGIRDVPQPLIMQSDRVSDYSVNELDTGLAVP